jgi:hypothetical protein
MNALLIDQTRRRSSSLDEELDKTHREFSELEREETEQATRQQADYRQWLARKDTRFRESLGRFLELFPQIRELDDDWRRQVSRGEQEFDVAVERSLRTLYAVWLGFSQLFQSKAEFLARHGSDFESALDHLGRYRRVADRLLRIWTPPMLSRHPSFRTPPLSAEATARIRELFPGKT